MNKNSNSHLTKDGKEPNAVLIRTDGVAELIHLNGFVNSCDLGIPLECSSTDIVLKNLPYWAERQFGIRLAGYVNRNGIPEGLDENETIEEISGYDYIAGDCVILGIDEKYNYLPLTPADAVKILKHFNG